MNWRVRLPWSEVGALSSAGTVAAVIFCCLPFATGIVGAGVAALGARVAPLQPYLVTLSLGLLAYAFFQVYRPGAATCSAKGCDRPSTLRVRQIALWLVAAAVALLLTVSWWANWVIYWML